MKYLLIIPPGMPVAAGTKEQCEAMRATLVAKGSNPKHVTVMSEEDWNKATKQKGKQ
jgi:hypothetical protein